MVDLVSDEFIKSILDEIEKLEDDKAVVAEEGKYITFTLAGGTFAVLLLKVREIIRMTSLTQVIENRNRSRNFVRLRDRMVPVYDLRALLGIEKVPPCSQTCIIIMETWHELKLKPFGIIVDSVKKVVTVQKEDLAALPEFLKKLNVDYISGIAKLHNRLVLLLNTDHLRILL